MVLCFLSIFFSAQNIEIQKKAKKKKKKKKRIKRIISQRKNERNVNTVTNLYRKIYRYQIDKQIIRILDT